MSNCNCSECETEAMRPDGPVDVTSVNQAFEEFLRTRRDHRDGLSARQQLWMAFKAGGDWTLAEIRKNIPGRDPGEAVTSDAALMANIQTVTELLSRDDITAYASAALQRSLTSLTLEMDRRAKERQPAPDHRAALADLVAFVDRMRDSSDGRWPEPDANCGVCSQGVSQSGELCAWHRAKGLVKS